MKNDKSIEMCESGVWQGTPTPKKEDEIKKTLKDRLQRRVNLNSNN
jgi:hypothetical protein